MPRNPEALGHLCSHKSDPQTVRPFSSWWKRMTRSADLAPRPRHTAPFSVPSPGAVDAPSALDSSEPVQRGWAGPQDLGWPRRNRDARSSHPVGQTVCVPCCQLHRLPASQPCEMIPLWPKAEKAWVERVDELADSGLAT